MKRRLTDKGLNFPQYGTNQKEFEHKCYNAYQLDWMLSHGYSLTDLKSIISNMFSEQVKKDERRLANNINLVSGKFGRVCQDFIYDVGFGGELFAGFCEFKENEYLDQEYMQHLFMLMPETDKMKELYHLCTQDCEDCK